MLIQYVIILGVALMFLFFLRHHGTNRTAVSVKIGFVLFGAFGIFAVLRPHDVSQLAQWLGVGRGTDLIVYALAVGFAFLAVNTYLRFKELEGRYAELARAIALQHGQYTGVTAEHEDSESKREDS